MDKFNNYIKLFNLCNWDIQLIFEDLLETNGTSRCVYNDYKAVIKIKANMNEEEIERTVIHELLHIVHRDEMDIIHQCIEDENINTLYTRFHERAIEQMTQIIYKLNND